MTISRKTLGRRIKILAGIVLILGMAFYFFQDKLIFQAVKLDRNHTYVFDYPFEEFFLKTADGEEINLVHFKSHGPSKGLILYFHGNADNLQRWGSYAGDFTRHQYDVLMMDYRGYGKSSGKPDEQALYEDAKTVLNWAKSNFSHKQLIIYGRSLGTAVASHLAMEAQPDLLILETPFDELRGAIIPFLRPLFAILPFSYTFPTVEHVALVNCRKVIFHGTDDMVTPISSALKLKPHLKNEDDFIVINEGTHGNLREFEEYHQRLADILR